MDDTLETVAALSRQDVFFALAVVATLATLALFVVTVRADFVGREKVLGRRERRRPAGGERDPRDALSLVGDTLAATHDPHALLPVILRATAEATGAAAGRLVDEGREVASVGSIPRSAEPLTLQLAPPGEGQTTMLLYPPAGGFEPESERLAVWLAAQAAIAVENARLHDVVQHQAATDELTGLVNRRRFMTALEHELARTTRALAPALILADLDDFKRVNDRFGHPVGDAVLQAFARALSDHVRDVDIPARLGGEEFAVLLPETPLAGAAAVAVRLQRSLAKVPVLVRAGRGLAVTASMGVAQQVQGESAESLLRRADAALYRAKADGKNRVVQADMVQPGIQPRG